MTSHGLAWMTVAMISVALTCFSVVQMMMAVTGDAASLATLTVFALLVGTLNDPVSDRRERPAYHDGHSTLLHT